MARLVAARVPAASPPERGSARHILQWLVQYPLPAYARRSSEDIDASIREERESWG